MIDKERIDDAYKHIDIDTDNILAYCDGEEIERFVKSIWDSTVTMHEIATVALKENAKLRELCADMWFWGYEGHIDSESQERQMKHIDGVLDRIDELGVPR